MRNIKWLLIILVIMMSCSKEERAYDLVVYGGTPSGIITAVEASKHGLNVLLVEQTNQIGGMFTSGLTTSESDHMINSSITGLARDFYIEMGNRFYDSIYFSKFRGGKVLNFKKGDPAMHFESRHAKQVFLDWINDYQIDVWYDEYLTEVKMDGNRITTLKFESGKKIDGQYFVDATYEGDLMALSGVSWTHGREAKSKYNESLAGIRFIDDTIKAKTVDKYGVLKPYFKAYDSITEGAADGLVMNYNFRPIMTTRTSNQYPIYKPEGYDASQFDFLAEFLLNNPSIPLRKLIGVYPKGNEKFEFNNNQKSWISLGMFGENEGYIQGDRTQREKVWRKHKLWAQGYLYFLSTDQRVPNDLQEDINRYGYAKDEFIDNNHFPNYLYIREGRRMIGEFVHTQHDIFKMRNKEDAVFLGSHWVDCHHVQRVALTDSTFTNEGRIWEVVYKPYEISFKSLLPKKQECKNLIVPVAASFSHVAFSSYRLETTWMQAGHVAGLAVSLAEKNNTSIQEISIKDLQNQLIDEGMILNEEHIKNYNDYDWLIGHKRYGKTYKRMYDE